MDLSIIIVNWNSRHYLEKCIGSIRSGTRGLNYEIIVIDAASFDGCDKMLSEQFPQVRFIQSPTNLGFAGANNCAFEQAIGEFLLFLNPDTELVGPAINKLYDALCTLPSAGVVGAKLLNSNGSIQTECIQAFPSILNQMFDLEALRMLLPHARLWGIAPLFETTVEPTEVGAVSGACLMIRRSTFVNVGRFSADYFMYSEDVDLCFKVKHSGLNNYYVPQAAVMHHGGRSSLKTGVSSFSSVMMLESRWRFFLKTRSRSYAFLYRGCMVAVSAIRLAIVLLACPILAIKGSGQVAANALKKCCARFKWSIGMENSALNLSRLRASRHSFRIENSPPAFASRAKVAVPSAVQQKEKVDLQSSR